MNPGVSTFERIAIIGLGLIGGSIGLAVREYLPNARTTAFDNDPAVRKRAEERGLADHIFDSAEEAVRDADLVILCVPVGAMDEIARRNRAGAGRRRGGQRCRLVEAVDPRGASGRAVPIVRSSPPTRLREPRTAARTPASLRCSSSDGASSPHPRTPTR